MATSMVALTALMLAVASVPAAARERAASGQRPGDTVMAPAFSTADAKAALRYWTPERMADARPMEGPAPKRETTRLSISDETAGVPTLVTQGGKVRRATLEAAATQPAAYAYPFPFTRRPLETQLYKVAQYRTVGKIFFRQKGIDYVCSGASIVAANKGTVFTAGHCLHAGDFSSTSWSTRIIFIPAYRDGAGPYGRFAARTSVVPVGWYDNGDPTFDFGAFSVDPNAAGQKLQVAVGGLGFAFSQSRVQHWDVFGYPAAPPFDGERIQLCEASHAADDRGAGAGPATVGIGCDLTGGSSGGPWITRLGRGNFLNGVTSYGPSDRPDATYSPYFGPAANQVRCAVAGGPNC